MTLLCPAAVIIGLAALLFWLVYRSGLFANEAQSAQLDAAERELDRERRR